MENKKRHIWIDMLKGYGIIIVTLGHLGVSFPIEKHIYSYHMFLFLFISGYLLNDNRRFEETLKAKTKHLLIPFLSWHFCSCIFGYILYKQEPIDFIRSFFMINGNMSFDRPIWFILVLYITEILYGIISYRNKLNLVSNLSVIGISLVLFCIFGNYKLPLMLNLVPFGIATYTFGYVYHKFFEYKFDMMHNLIFISLAIILLGICSVWFGETNIRISYTAGIFGNFVLCIIAGFSRALFFTILFRKIFISKQCDNILSYIGKQSFSIMTMQYYFFFVYKVIAKKIFNIPDIWNLYCTPKAIVLCMITIILIVIIVKIYKEKLSEIVWLNKFANLFGIF